jgi:hypothetical protein
MSFTWKRGTNPYVDNAFGILGLGPFANKVEINQRAKELIKMAKTAARTGSGIDEHTINDASKRLQQPRTHAEETLLVHPQTPQDTRRRNRLVKEVKETAVPEKNTAPLRFRDPLALFWFTPLPDPAIAQAPSWEDLGLPASGGEEDLLDDVVFDC